MIYLLLRRDIKIECNILLNSTVYNNKNKHNNIKRITERTLSKILSIFIIKQKSQIFIYNSERAWNKKV